jgi:mono/diheme cytochrome c family protein
MTLRTTIALAGVLLACGACSKTGGDKTAGESPGVTAPQPASEQVSSSPDGPGDIEAPDVPYSTAADDVDKGKAIFASKGCNACHRIGGGKLVGPDLKGVTARRHEKWIEKMILHPEAMLREDETAKGLFKTHMTPMANQSVDPKTELPYLLAYLKANE